MTDLVYLDFNATTPVDPDVLQSMLPWLTERFWNAASSHFGGREAANAVHVAREQMAEAIGARPGEIIWTSGATESNNLAIKGVVEGAPPSRRRVVTLSTEHRAVLDTVEWLHNRGVPTTVLRVDTDGAISLEELIRVLSAGDVALVTVMAANNETGVLADLPAISECVHEAGAILHTDAAQLVGRLPFDVRSVGVDLVSISAHKMYGPKGVGALYVRKSTPIAPQIHGGGHERGLRSGTTNVAGVIGLGTSAQIATRLLETEPAREKRLVETFLNALRANLSGIEIVAPDSPRLPNTVNVRILDADADAVMANAPMIAVSSGSACTSHTPGPSHVLTSMGFDDVAASECIRVSIGRTTCESDLLLAASALSTSAERVRSYAA